MRRRTVRASSARAKSPALRRIKAFGAELSDRLTASLYENTRAVPRDGARPQATIRICRPARCRSPRARAHGGPAASNSVRSRPPIIRWACQREWTGRSRGPHPACAGRRIAACGPQGSWRDWNADLATRRSWFEAHAAAGGYMPEPLVQEDINRGWHAIYRTDTSPGPAASWLIARFKTQAEVMAEFGDPHAALVSLQGRRKKSVAVK